MKQTELLENPHFIDGSTPAHRFLDFSEKSELARTNSFELDWNTVVPGILNSLNQLELLTQVPVNVENNLRVIFYNFLKAIFGSHVPPTFRHSLKQSSISTSAGETIYSLRFSVTPLTSGETKLEVSDYSVNIDPATFTKRVATLYEANQGEILAKFFTREGRIDKKTKTVESEVVRLSTSPQKDTHF